jgi:hypothetical protein
MGTLRKLFGPSQEEIWRQLAAEISAEYIQGGILKPAKLRARHKEWLITLDVVTEMVGEVAITYTRMRAPYVNPGAFRFTLHRSGFFTPLGKLLGMQDIEIGDAEFDKSFVIKSGDVTKVRALLSNPIIRKIALDQPDILLTVKDDEGWFGAEFPKGVDELYFQANGVIKDVERLKKLYALFAETLNQLCLMGEAYENAPGVTL